MEIMMGNETDEIIERKKIESLLQNYKKDLKEPLRGSEFVRDSIDLLHYNLQTIGLKRGGSYIDSPECLKNKKAKINPENNNCFQYALTVALNDQNIGKNPQRISKIKPFINQYNWKEIDFASHPKDLKKFEQNVKTIALNILFVPYITKKIRLAHKSKHNFKRENQVILLMITDGKKWHYLAVKSVSALLRGITSNHNGDFYCLNCFHSYSTKNKLKKHERVCNDHDYCYEEIPNEDNKILKYNQREKSLKAADCYKYVDCMERFWKSLRDHVMKIVNCEEKEMTPLTDKENKSYQKQKVYYICKKEFITDENDKNAFELYQKVRDHCHYTGKFRGAAHSICNLRYKTANNGSTYDYHFIINKLAK